MFFFVGLHQPSDAQHFERCMVSVTRLERRKSDFAVGAWIMDSGAFTELSRHGHYRQTAQEYARQILRWRHCGTLLAAVSQDFMCEPFILAKTGLSVAEHQAATICRYREISDTVRHVAGDRVYVMPVLQGYWPEEYVAHLDQYGDLLRPGQWVGVGSVCKRNVDVEEIEHVLMAIKRARPDLRLHGFGVKLTALESSVVRQCLYSADSMAWSYSARKQGRNANDWREAMTFAQRIEGQEISQREYQPLLF